VRLNRDQRKQIAEILGNISVAWFTAGIIAPFFIQQKDFVVLFINFMVGLFFSIVFVFGSLQIIRTKQ